MKEPFLIKPEAYASSSLPPSGGNTSGLTRRAFLKRTGGATVAAVVAFHITDRAHAADEDGSESGSGSEKEKFYKIKCVAWPNPAHNQSYNYITGTEYYVTNIFLAGAAQGALADEFEIEVTASGIYHWVPWWSTTTHTRAAMEKVVVKLTIEGGETKSIRVTHLSGDGKDQNGDFWILLHVDSVVGGTAKLMEDGWSITNGTVGYDDGAQGTLTFAPGSTEIDSVGLGSAFTIVEVDSEGNEL